MQKTEDRVDTLLDGRSTDGMTIASRVSAIRLQGVLAKLRG